MGPSRWARLAVVGAVLAPKAMMVPAAALAPVLLREAPLLLLALYPYKPWALLVSATTSTAAFLAVMLTARAAALAPAYLLGRWCGPTALSWVSRRTRSRSPRSARRFPDLAGSTERVFARRGALAVLLLPGTTTSVLAGSARMPPGLFAAAAGVGLLIEAVTTRLLAAAAAAPLTALLRLITGSWVAAAATLTPVTLLATASYLRQRRSRAAHGPPPTSQVHKHGPPGKASPS